MALTLATTLRDAIADAVNDTINLSGPGTLQLQTSGDAEVATITFSNPAFTGPSTGVLTADTSPALSDTDAAGGTMAKFIIANGTPTTLITGSVGTTGENINFAGGVTIGAGDTVTITSLTITCPAS